MKQVRHSNGSKLFILKKLKWTDSPTVLEEFNKYYYMDYFTVKGHTDNLKSLEIYGGVCKWKEYQANKKIAFCQLNIDQSMNTTIHWRDIQEHLLYSPLIANLYNCLYIDYK